MNSRQLTYFVAIAETGSFTAAAKSLGLSQPPLSKQIQTLEEELGVELFTRGSRTAHLTEAGSYLYGKAKDILSLMDSAARDLADFDHIAAGVLKLGTISSCGHVLTRQILRPFCADHPRVRFELTEGNTYELMEQLKNGTIDCAVLRTPFNSEGLEVAEGPEEPLAAAGVPAFFRPPSGPDSGAGRSLGLAELAGKPLIYYRRFDSILSVAFQNLGVEPSVFCRNDDARTCLIWAQAGLGVALVPKGACLLSLSDGLEVHPIHSEGTATRLAAVYKKNGYVSHIAKEFVSYFRTYSAAAFPASVPTSL